MSQQKAIEFIARAVVVRAGRVLLCRLKRETYYFFPGGHVEFGETAERALRRELKEEFGATVVSTELMGLVQNFFISHGARHHELNLVYAVRLKRFHAIARERHIEFSWYSLRDLNHLLLEPKILKQTLPRWFRSHKPFFVAEKYH